MIKRIFVTLALTFCLPSLASEGVLDTLKSTPASKYELGKVQLDIMAFILTDKLKGNRMEDTSFELRRFSLRETPERLNFFVSFVGRAQDMTEEQCKSFLANHTSMFTDQNIITGAWQGLTEEQYENLRQEIGFGVELISKENESFKMACESGL